MKNRRILLTLLLCMLMLMLPLYGCGSGTNTAADNTPAGEQQPVPSAKPTYTIVDVGVAMAKTVLPITVLSSVGSVWIFKNAAEFQLWITFTYPILALFMQSLLPLLLLAIDSIKAKLVNH
ncbi:hypothetical protein [Paenibacillus zanthoxyli]|uniref:hypothetical protein n=1 Tax=Paenibacillus zanthoxyli TaxID=369399 RepID=UPI000472002D|nr:hypothetical protein [Paenibacillus zanthoxyli]